MGFIKKKFLVLTSLALVVGTFAVGGIKNTSEVEAADGELIQSIKFTKDTFSKKISSYTDTWSATQNDISYQISNFNNNNKGWDYIKAGRKNYTSIASISTLSSISEEVASIVIDVDSVSSSLINSCTMYISTDQLFDDGDTLIDFTNKINQGETIINIDSPMPNCYYKVEFDLKSGTKNGFVQISGLSFFAPIEISDNEAVVSFNSNGGSQVNPITVTKGETITQPENPTRDGYTFVEWQLNGETYDFNQPVTDNIELVAVWEKVYTNLSNVTELGKTYNVKGKVISNTSSGNYAIQDEYGFGMWIYDRNQPIKVGEVIEFTGTLSEYNGGKQLTNLTDYNVLSEELNITTTKITDNVNNVNDFTLVEATALKVTNITSSSVTFTNGLAARYTVNYASIDQDITTGSFVNLEGVLGYYSGNKTIYLTSLTKADTVTVTFNSNGGTSVEPQTILPNTLVTEPSAPTKADTAEERYTFAGWYDNAELSGNPFDFNTPITENKTLYAKWDVKKISVNESFVNTTISSQLAFNFKESLTTIESEITDIVSTGEQKDNLVVTTPFISKDSGNYADGSLKLDDTGCYIGYEFLNELSGPVNISLDYKLNVSLDSNTSNFDVVAVYGGVEEKIDSVVLSSTTYVKYDKLIEKIDNLECIKIVYNKDSGNMAVKAMSVSYQGEKETKKFSNFSNVSMNFKYNFDFTGAYDLKQTGIIVSKTDLSLNSTSKLDSLPENALVAVNETNKTEFTVSLNNVPLTDADTSIYVYGYVQTSEGYFFTNVKETSVSDMLLEYALSDAEVVYDDCTIKVSDIANAFIEELTAE